MNSSLALLGLARRAGKLTGGSTNCLQAIRRRQAKLIIIARDAGNSRRKIIGSCLQKGISWIEYGTKEEFQRVLGIPSCFWAILSAEFSQGFLNQVREESGDDK